MTLEEKALKMEELLKEKERAVKVEAFFLVVSYELLIDQSMARILYCIK